MYRRGKYRGVLAPIHGKRRERETTMRAKQKYTVEEEKKSVIQKGRERKLRKK